MIPIVPISETNEWRATETFDGVSPGYRRCIRVAVSCSKEIALQQCGDSHGEGSVSQEARRVKILKAHRSINHRQHRSILS
jgi:hypothetical protein